MYCVDLLRSRPHAEDGVYQHKSRWGAVTEVDDWPHTLLCFFIPPQVEVPACLARLLVWQRDHFAELQLGKRETDRMSPRVKSLSLKNSHNAKLTDEEIKAMRCHDLEKKHQ